MKSSHRILSAAFVSIVASLGVTTQARAGGDIFQGPPPPIGQLPPPVPAPVGVPVGIPVGIPVGVPVPVPVAPCGVPGIGIAPCGYGGLYGGFDGCGLAGPCGGFDGCGLAGPCGFGDPCGGFGGYAGPCGFDGCGYGPGYGPWIAGAGFDCGCGTGWYRGFGGYWGP